MSIINRIKKFFTIKDQNKLDLSRKVKFGTVPAKPDLTNNRYSVNPLSATPKDREAVNGTNQAIVGLVNQMDPTERDAIEAAKKRLFKPFEITDAHKEHILQACGYQKDTMIGGERAYDPRLVAVINYSMNMYFATVSNKLDDIVKDIPEVNK